MHNLGNHHAGPAAKKPGVRERSKRERQDRIAIAARELFTERGYDATTLRRVAECAGLGLGTLFTYIRDKRDLIYLVFNQEVSAVTDYSLAAPKPWQSFPEKLLSMIVPAYRFFCIDPGLSRILLSELLQHTPGFHLEAFIGLRDRFMQGIEELVAEAQRAGEIRSTQSADLIARNIFFLHTAALRWWLAEAGPPDWRAGVRDFGVILDLQLRGLDMHPDPKKTQAVNSTGPNPAPLKQAAVCSPKGEQSGPPARKAKRQGQPK